MKEALQLIKPTVPNVVIDLRYATKNNIVSRKLYADMPAMLRPNAVRALKAAAESLKKQNLKLVIWDAYRPPSVQEILREICEQDVYVAPVSNHSRGTTVDVTLCDRNGNYLDMGTDFDAFTSAAHADNPHLNSEQKHNRTLLSAAMATAGFKQWPYEWWHFDLDCDTIPEVIEDPA